MRTFTGAKDFVLFIFLTLFIACGPAPNTATGPATGSPGAPKNVAATAGNAQAILTWLPPDTNGGSAITGYTATSSPEGKTCSSTGPCTCVITGLTNGTPYTFTVTATNSAGAGSASSASSAVTPAAAVAIVGATWTTQTPGITSYMYFVTWGNNQLVATEGLGGKMVTSPDGITWTEHSTSATNYMTSAVWTGTQWVAVGGSGDILTSPDGATWTSRHTGGGEYISTVTWSGQQLAYADDNSLYATSNDGITWTTIGYILAGDAIYNLTWMKPGTSAAQLVAVGNFGLVALPCGTACWSKQTTGTTNHLLSAVWTGTQLVVVGLNGTILTSPDGITWTSRVSGTTTANLNSVTWTGSQLVVVGVNPGTLGSNNGDGSGIILTSPDGVTWTTRSSASTPFLNSVAWTGSKLVAVGGATHSIVLTSP